MLHAYFLLMALSKKQIQYYRSLKRKKFRLKYNKFPVEGDKIVREVLDYKPSAVHAIMGLSHWLDPLLPHLESREIPFYEVSEKELQQLSGMSTPNQVIAYLDDWEAEWEPGLWKNHLCFFLDGIQDPGNAGTLMRIADWFGMPYLFGSLDSADFHHPKVVQASMGSFLRVACIRVGLPALLEESGELPVLGAMMGARSVFEGPWPSRGILVLGREGSGIREETAGLLTERISIPGRGGGESLNAAVAGGILAAHLLHGQTRVT
jgi:TrmH family RNA methyltransferase